MSDLEAALAAIPKMSALELADRWQALGRGAAPRVPLRVLQRLYAQLLQEQALAGLSVEALEELAAVAAKAGKNKTPTPPPPRQLNRSLYRWQWQPDAACARGDPVPPRPV